MLLDAVNSQQSDNYIPAVVNNILLPSFVFDPSQVTDGAI